MGNMPVLLGVFIGIMLYCGNVSTFLLTAINRANEVVEFNFVFDKHSRLCLRQSVLPALTMVQYQSGHSWIKGLLIN
ncbi:hypothetical protein PRUB_a0592 [Pseudoalteromonas rubra]|uniref:Uncharacterized protein n=1 Tax=Pseudoalteromonas rubra TaxID=43658 RepID=A0A8T0C683_9GAMM|nr:hypothetical protein PRUB_a0588 [Pseudoalteromonas rubra]KAF7786123.1 hypothetical protein PRUB_a0592 [Pseudoalteromonas rubra]